MKTQFDFIIRGNYGVMRDLTHAKYNGLNIGEFDGCVGTNFDERAAIMDKVLQENGETLRVMVKGVALTLARGSSVSGKTWWYSCELTEDQAVAIAGDSFKLPDGGVKDYALNISSEGDVDVQRWRARNERAQMKWKQPQPIDSAFVVILD